MRRLCLWIIDRFLDPDISAQIAGDILEQPGRGALWVCRETLAALWHLRARPQPGDTLVTTFLSDLRLAARLLRRSPTFAVVSVCTLGLAIGATAAIFSVIEPVLLEPLPYKNADHLAFVWGRDRNGGQDNLGYATYRDLVAGAKTIETAAALGDWQPTLSSQGEPERVSGDRVSWTYFRTIGVRPELGRDFTAEEDLPGQNTVVILSHGLWARRYGADPAIIGRPISIGGNPYVVVGVMPADFDNVVSPAAELWRPLAYLNQPYACRTCQHLRMLIRVREGVPMSRATTELDGLQRSLEAQYPKEYATVGAMVVTVQDEMAREFRPALLALGGAVVLVLLIAIANAVSLQLSRAVRREEEFAIRAALGAGRSRVIRQLLTEGLLLALLGGIAGLVVARVSVPLLVANLPPALPRIGAVHVDFGAMAVTAAIVIAMTVALGLAPARGRSIDLGISLRGSARTSGTNRHAARATLVTAEVALAMMLLVSGALVAKSLNRLLSVNPGFDPTHLLSLEINAVGPTYQDNARVYAYHQRVRDAVRALPGVVDVATSNQLPLAGNMDMYGVVDPANVPANPELVPSGDRYVVSPEYLRTMRIPILRGRGLTATDVADSANRVALVSAALANTLWPGQDAIGKHIRLGGDTRPSWTIVGVTGDVKHRGLDANITQQWYVPEGLWFGGADNQESLIIRTSIDPAALASSVRAAVAAIDRTQPIIKIATMDQLIAATTAQRRLAMVLFAAFAIAALLLAVAGIYGVLAGSVAERTREIGVRSALGATPRDIVGLVLSQGGKLAAIGIALGLIGSAAASGLLRALLFEIGPNDPATLVGVGLLLGAVAVAACLVPAMRAARVDPSRALRSE